MTNTQTELIEQLQKELAQERELTQTLRTALYTDEVTGCLTRKWLQDNEDEYGGIVAFIDLDGLKQTNDTLGHQAGDTLLANAAIALLDTGLPVIRLGGDEFLLLGAYQVARKALDNAGISASIGESLERNLWDAVNDADQKMYSEKMIRKS